MQQKPIVIFDSGVGGLSIYQKVREKLPFLSVIYCSDSEGFPYGPKPENDVVDRTLYCLTRLVANFQPALAIIACNTASTISLPRARQLLDIPIVGVVPAIKPASQTSQKRCIGLLATPGTIARDYTNRLIHEFAGDCEVIQVGSSELVHLAEQHLRGQTINPEDLKKIIEPLFSGNNWPDCVVLGCTHFPLVQELLDSVVPAPVTWIDSGEAIARRVASLLEEHYSHHEGPVEHRFLYTGSDKSVRSLLPALEAMNFSEITCLDNCLTGNAPSG
ncbi:glutamate racemase [Endozoicomonas sp. 8E]|uniref:glutamate racemase n=1 Tax=Endozoicomonas sp. 8E TaxID=3035692 RepID=UPI0029393BB8|nr:glutamate racemase [Endozoicomonas sp. 8E]WOG27989.1 glutamate racemase [Endozoicomonas sp. 8E]